MNNIVERFISLPMAIKVFRQDNEKFADFKFSDLYQEKLDAAIRQLEIDFNELKREMYTVHHLDVKYLGKEGNEVRYTVNNEVISFSPKELKKMTRDVMKEYLYKTISES